MGTVTSFLASVEEPGRSLLARLYSRAVATVPQAEEGTSYGMAALRYRGRPLLGLAVTSRGFTVYPFSAAVVAATLADAEELRATKGGIQFTASAPLPDDVFDAIVARRRDEIDAALTRR